jgi:2-dehydro-3-deoxygluconokinase
MTENTRFAAIGECMIELRDQEKTEVAFGGDTYNTTAYLARLGAGRGIHADYITALGDDSYSDEMLESWRSEGVGTDLVRTLPGRLPGLYSIRTDQMGERSFYYWRQQAAARDLWKNDDWQELARKLCTYNVIYLSGITLSIYDSESRDRLATALEMAREAGATIAFDGNYRPHGWPDAETARRVMTRFLQLTDIALPTFDDEQALFGDTDVNACVARLAGCGISEMAIKLGATGCLLSVQNRQVFVTTEEVDDVVDTTAAGDSFNAGYLASRMIGAPQLPAAQAANRLADMVIQYPGAIIPKENMPDVVPTVTPPEPPQMKVI